MNNRTLQLNFILALLVGVGSLTLTIIWPFVITILLALIFSVALYPLFTFILRKVRGRKGTASTLTIFVAVICLLTPLLLISTLVFNEAVQLYNTLANVDNKQLQIVEFLTKLGSIANSYVPGTGSFFANLSNNVTLYIREALAWLINHLGGVLSGASVFLLHAFIFIVTLYYVLIDGENLKRRVIKLSPLDDVEDAGIFVKLEMAINSVLKGNVVIACIQGLLAGVGFAVFGIPNSILWGMMTAISSLIPSIGTTLVIAPAVLYLIITGSTFQAIGLLLWGVVIVGAVDNVLKPKLIGDQLQVHPLFVLLSILGGISLFGPIGILLGPLVFSLFFALVTVYTHLREKNSR